MTRPLRRPLLTAAAAAVAAASVSAQSYQELVDTRNPANPWSSVLQIEAGAIGTFVDGSNPDKELRGLEEDISWDGHVYYRDDQAGGRRGALEAYVGRDGVFGGFTDGKLIGDDTLTKLEFHARPWMFYRDGFYDGNALRQNGFFDGSEYEAYLGFGREANDGLYVEFGPYYRKHSFDRSRLTPVTYTLPNDFDAYGGRLYLEQRAVQMDRRRGLPQQGFVLSLVGEREWNDSDDPFGTALSSTRLPSAVWRARGRLEWYIPASDQVTWEVFLNGGVQDEKDRLQNIDGSRPLGYQWGDGVLRLRFHLGESITLAPFGQVQYSRVLAEDGYGSTKDFFLGGGAEGYMHFSNALSLHAYYSYLNNENRPSIRIDQDLRGEHMVYVGMVLRLFASRR